MGAGFGSPWLVRGEYESGLRFNNAWARQKFPRKPTRRRQLLSNAAIAASRVAVVGLLHIVRPKPLEHVTERDDDYDVVADGKVIGRIMRAAAAPEGAPWLWTLAFGHHEDRTPAHGEKSSGKGSVADIAVLGNR
jgi:hypothetical protein